MFGTGTCLCQLAELPPAVAEIAGKWEVTRANDVAAAAFYTCIESVLDSGFDALVPKFPVHLLRKESSRADVGAIPAADTGTLLPTAVNLSGREREQAVHCLDDRHTVVLQRDSHHRTSHQQARVRFPISAGGLDEFMNRCADSNPEITGACD
jgi:hypothetical protein